MNSFIDAFTKSDFFNPPTDKVYHISVSMTNNKGRAEKSYVNEGVIREKVIRPIKAFERKNFTIDADAIMNVPKRLQFYTGKNTSDIIKWKDRYYKIVDEYNRQDSNGYAYRYMLKYLNRDAEIDGKL